MEKFELDMLDSVDLLFAEGDEVKCDPNCGLSICLKLFNNAELTTYSALRLGKLICNYDVHKKDNIIKLKFKKKIIVHLLHDLKKSILPYLGIKGDEQSFAIIKFYNCDYLMDNVKPFYEDFETPGNTIDIPKLLFSLKCMHNQR
jgi:hypothetical protein